MSRLSIEARVQLWDAINKYAAACGAHPTRGGVRRELAVVEVERVIAALLTSPPPLPDVEFEHAIRAKGFRPNLWQLGCMRTGYDLRCEEERSRADSGEVTE